MSSGDPTYAAIGLASCIIASAADAAEQAEFLEPISRQGAIRALQAGKFPADPKLATAKVSGGKVAAYLLLPAGTGLVIRCAWPMTDKEAAKWFAALADIKPPAITDPFVRTHRVAYLALCKAFKFAPDRFPSRHFNVLPPTGWRASR